MSVIIKPLMKPITKNIPKVAHYEFSPLRQELIDQGLLTPVSLFLGLEPNDPRRVNYEKKLIVAGD